MKQPVCGRQDRVRNTQTVRTVAICAWDWDVYSQVCKGAGSWCVGTGEQAQSENCCWLWGDGLRGREGGNLQQGKPREEDRTAMEVGCYCSVTRRGRGHYCSLSLPTHRHLPVTIKEAQGTSLVAQWLGVHLTVGGHGFEPWSWKIPCAAYQLDLRTTATEPAL